MRNANGQGGVVKLSGNRRRPYAVRITEGWTPEGKQKYKVIGYFEDRMDALQCLIDYNKGDLDMKATSITVKEVFEKWSLQRFPHISISRQKMWNSAFKYVSAYEKKPFISIKTAHIQDMVDNCAAPSMKVNIRQLFNQLFEYGIANDITKTNYSQFVIVPKEERKADKVPFSKTEIKKLWQNIEKKNASIVLLLIYTGCRIGELLDITKDKINLEERYMIGGSKTEAGRDRVIPIHKDIMPLIKKHLESNSNYLILNSKGEKMNYSTFQKRHWHQLMNELEMEHKIHDTRHTFITQLKKLNVDEHILKEIVGHKNNDITERYTHRSPKELVETVDLLKLK